ncbi:3-phosphoshikimate 1-carboxyvinyltransferase [uncultured archaeon]|nr:3-phosphoshikimate 1-carboxyvinyltransferase [uncultured archaeon]
MRCIKPSRIEGSASAPPSKSMMIRAVAAAALARGKSEISNPAFCDDALAAMGCAGALGAKFRKKNGKLIVEGTLAPSGRALDCRESGLCARMFAPIAALFGKRLVLAGRGSLLTRNIGMMEGPLTSLGAECSTSSGHLPVAIQGPIHGGNAEIDGAESSQFLTGLLMALPLCKEDSAVAVRNLKSVPYVKMTLSLLKEFGVRARHTAGLEKFEIAGGQHYKPTAYEVEGDWSGASFLLVAGAIAGRVSVRGLRNDSLQADRRIVDALELAGAKVKLGKDSATVESGPLSAFEFDAADCPDLFPPLAALACNCSGKSRIAGAGRLRGKESDRSAALVSELGKLGAKASVKGDVMEITGCCLRGGSVDSHNDHRIAMACATAALNSRGGARIKNEKCVAKSYPGFFEDLGSLQVGK